MRSPWVEGATARKPEATPIRKYFRIGRGWRHPRPSRSKSWTGQRQDARGRSGGTCQRHPLKRHSRPVSRTGNSSRALGLLCNFPQGGLCCWPQAGCSLCCGDEHGFNSSGFPPHRIRAASWVPGGVANTKRGYKWGYKKKNESTKPKIHAGFRASFSSARGCGWPPAETPQIGLFLGQSRLYSLFGLRVGADGGLAKSTTYARRFTVNQGQQTSVQLDDIRRLY